MSWGFIGGAAISVIGGAMASKGSKDASETQQQGVSDGIASQERMFNKSLELQQPYREAGYGAIEQLQGLADPAGRAELLDNYYDSAEYGAMEAQSEERQMRNALATGGGRGGGNQVAMSTIAPQLGQQYLSNMNSQYTSLANMGMGAAGQGASAANSLGNGISALQQSSAQASAANDLAQSNIWGNVVSDVGAYGLDYLNRNT